MPVSKEGGGGPLLGEGARRRWGQEAGFRAGATARQKGFQFSRELQGTPTSFCSSTADTEAKKRLHPCPRPAIFLIFKGKAPPVKPLPGLPELPVPLPFPTKPRQLFPLVSGSPASSAVGLGVFTVSSPARVRVWGLRSSFEINPPAAASW